MFVRNLLQAGEYVTCVPVGIPVTLQYDERGIIHRVLEFHNKDAWVDVTDIFLPTTIKLNQIPNTITVKNGTTWVRGVYYIDKVYKLSGDLPECVLSDMLLDYKSNPDKFTFYAGGLESLAMTFRGATSIRQWLSVAGFKLLPGFVVPYGINETTFGEMVTKQYPFRYPFISSYILYHTNGTISYPSTNIRQHVVKKVESDVDVSGCIYGKLYYDKVKEPRLVMYSDVVRININPNCVVLENSDGDIIYAYNYKNASQQNTITCAWCGKLIKVPKFGVTKCGDDHCKSVLYSRLMHLLTVFDLPTLSYDRYLDIVGDKNHKFKISDIFSISDYKDIDINVTLSQVLSGLVPRSVVFDPSMLSDIVQKCNDSREVLMYYLKNASRIRQDLELSDDILNSVSFSQFIKWLNDPINIEDMEDILLVPNIHIKVSNNKYSGAPVFRNQLVMLTGTFQHGDLNTIAEILQSYDARVIKYYDDKINYLVIGDLNEGTNAVAVRAAQKHNIPVMSETEFFDRFSIEV